MEFDLIGGIGVGIKMMLSGIISGILLVILFIFFIDIIKDNPFYIFVIYVFGLILNGIVANMIWGWE